MLSEISKTVIVMDPANADWHPGCQSRPAAPTSDVAPSQPGRQVLLHIRDAAAGEPDTNVGWWVVNDLRAGRHYTFSCDAYLPSDFSGSHIKLCLGHPLERDVTADLSVRDRWQTLLLQLTMPYGLAELSVVLRVDSEVETVLYSSAWTLEYVTVEPSGLASPLFIAPVAPAPVELARSELPAGPPRPRTVFPPPPTAELTEDESFIALARAMAEEREPADLGLLVSAYTRGVCSHFDYLQHQAQTLIDQVARRLPAFTGSESLYDEGRAVRRDVVAALCPELLPSLYTPRSNEGLEEIPLLEPCPNELTDDRLPSRISSLRHVARRPAVTAYATTDACLYTHPYRYQVLSKDRRATWLSGSPRGLSRDAIGATELIEVDKDVVVLQDRFDFTAISHFLLDGVSRALLLARAFGDLRSSLLVFGGVPGEFHIAVCDVLREKLDLGPDNILFPDRPLTIETTRRCIWFSDQVETYLHPAQMAHPTSIGLLRSIVEALPGEPPDGRRVYLSHTGASPSNEKALKEALEGRGFVAISVDGLSIEQQVGLFRNAEVIVTPSGPHLTHIIEADRLRDVVELFPPEGGSDAFGLIAAAGGIRHTAAIGTGDGSNYEIDIGAVIQGIDVAVNSRTSPFWHKSTNLLPGSRLMLGFQTDPENTVADAGLPGLIAGNAVNTHRGGAGDSGYSILGRWPRLRLIPGLRYTASCWVYIPEQFAGLEILLYMTGAAIRHAEAADTMRRELWQRIVLTAIPLADECDLELRMLSSVSASFHSTCWQIERGDTATAYIGTP